MHTALRVHHYFHHEQPIYKLQRCFLLPGLDHCNLLPPAPPARPPSSTQEPEESFSSAADGSSRHPGPLEELEFWEQKAADLNGIFLQLQSNRVRKILRYLDSSK